jgi:cell shape-determining protein MreC
MDGRYPAGMPIGKIDQIHNLSGSLFWQAKISLLSQAATSREVLILIQPAASTPVSPTP